MILCNTGFSNDNQMGDDNVVLCTSSGLIEHRYNNADKNTPQLLNSTNPTEGLTNMKVKSENGWLFCSFTRLVKIQSIEKKYFDLSKNYIILSAYGVYDDKTSKNKYLLTYYYSILKFRISIKIQFTNTLADLPIQNSQISVVLKKALTITCSINIKLMVDFLF